MDKQIIDKKIQDLYCQGFCELESVHDAYAASHQESILYAGWERQSKPALTDWGFGVDLRTIHEIAPYFDCPLANAVAEGALQDRPRLCQAGSRMSNQDSDLNIGWHHHYSWDSTNIRVRHQIERILVFFYPKGLSPAIGPLFVMPRRVDEEIPGMLGEFTEDWPGQVEVPLPPGSAVIVDSAVYHTAKQGSEPGLRYLWGGHYQGWSNHRPHKEDQDMKWLSKDLAILQLHPGLKQLAWPTDDAP